MRSGSRELVSGVGTQTITASQDCELGVLVEVALEAVAERRQVGVGDVLDVAAPVVQRLDLAGVGVEPDDLVPGLGEGDGQGQADVSEPDDPDLHRGESRSWRGASAAKAQRPKGGWWKSVTGRIEKGTLGWPLNTARTWPCWLRP